MLDVLGRLQHSMRRKCVSAKDIMTLDAHLREFARDGLRTLVVAKRELHQDEANAWLCKFRAAAASVGAREERLEGVAALIEQDLLPLGSTAIEDKLQVKRRCLCADGCEAGGGWSC